MGLESWLTSVLPFGALFWFWGKSNLVAIQLCFPPAKSGVPEIHVLLTHHILLCVCVLTFLAEAMQYRIPHVDQGVVLSVGKHWKMKRFFFFFLAFKVYSSETWGKWYVTTGPRGHPVSIKLPLAMWYEPLFSPWDRQGVKRWGCHPPCVP